jgi:curved DNA-binding protein CbpA
VTNHYKILGISSNASQEEIRRSFRNLALKYHPDRNKNIEEAKQKFVQIAEAYDILSDEQARKNYDSNIYNYGSYNYAARPRRERTSSSARPCESTYYADLDGLYSYAEIKRRYKQSREIDSIWITLG